MKSPATCVAFPMLSKCLNSVNLDKHNLGLFDAYKHYLFQSSIRFSVS